MGNPVPLGIIAGGGDLPLKLAHACEAQGRAYIILALKGSADPAIEGFRHVWVGLGAVGATLDILAQHHCQEVVMAGHVARPDFTSLQVDFIGMRSLPKIAKAALKGDDTLLRAVADLFEKKGVRVVGAQSVFADLLSPDGIWGKYAPDDRDRVDIMRGQDVLQAIGPFDIGQAVVVCEEQILAIEAAEGTDAMLEMCASLPVERRGTPTERRGVLVKLPKPHQDRRIDLPVIGVRTVENVAAAGLRGLAVAAGAALVLDRTEVVKAADQAGLFVLGIKSEDLSDA